ncbi:NAD(P)-dependent oxidoreductase [Streptomyces xanthii]|uniref:NAD(P)-dependent oxidoreductase n=1 Tax=Streptomyces xanthii TaxID=2768069 RepID=A0A7H1BI40_9ACTN|nr:NAD(P)-binding domain-containing protein [Streptomyces xanthii]QNS08395.1 NAD(P)-dependent oxidoreductase [Streptomyces xanthii]
MTRAADTTNRAVARACPVTVLGLGAMGSAIARSFLDRGHPTTVWNRTAAKADALADAGATAVPTAADAVAASPLVVVALLDGTAVEQVMTSVGTAITGRTLVNVTSGSPSQARANERWAREHGAAGYIDGNIMGHPPCMGTQNILLTFSGSGSSFAAHEGTLRELGTVTYHGEDPGAAAVEFLAQVATSYELLIGYLHTLRLLRAEGADLAGFTDRFGASLAGYPALLTSMVRAVESGKYGPDLGSLDVQAALMDDLIGHRESLGVESVRMREVKKLMDRRIADGHGHQGFSGLFELLAPQGEA